MKNHNQSELDSTVYRPTNMIPDYSEDRNPLSPAKEEKEGLIQHVQINLGFQDFLVNLVELASQQRKFTEDVDKLEKIGGFFLLFSQEIL